MTNITTKIAKNGVKMYYLNGKRISRDKAIEISKNVDNEMLTNALGSNVELKDAQAILVIATKDPLEAGKDREFGWCFTNVIDAVEAAKKVAALFGDRFIKADVRGDATFDNKVIATVDAAGNVEIKKQTPEYIFTAYQTVTGVDCNGRTERVESFATTCKELGDDDNFTGLYRAVTFYEDWHYNAWDIKTADGKLIAKGNTEAELKKAYENIKAGNVEVSEEIAEINAADVKVNVADDGKVIEQIKVDVDTAIKIINRLNYRNDTFVYRHATFDDYDDIKYRHFNAYRDNGESDGFAITEIVINGKLEIVRFANLFRDIIVHLQIGNVNYTIGDKGAIVLTAADKIADNTVTFYPNATPKPCTGKLFGYDYCEYHSVEEYISELKLTQSAVIMENLFKNANGSFSYDGWGRKTYYMTDCYREAYYVACDTEKVCLDSEDTANLIYVEQQLKNIVNGSDGSEEDIDDDNVFDLLPALDELNDVDIVDGDDGDGDEATTDWNSTFHTFEIGKTYFCSNEVDGKAEVTTLTVIDRTAAMLTGKTAEGTRKYHIGEAVNSEVVKLHEGIDAPRIYAGFEYTDDVKAVSTDNHSCFVDEVAAIFGEKKIADKPADTVDTPPDEKSFELTVNNERVFFIDGKFDSVFSYTYDAGFATEYSNYYYFERINQKHGCISRMKLIDDEEEFFALMVERGACTIDGDNPDNEPMSDYEISQGLTAKLKEVTRKADYMDVTTQDGGHIFSRFFNVEVFVDPDSDGFIFTNYYETFARYDTKEQCEYVIDWLAKVIERGDEEFEFPTAEFAALEIHAYELLLRYLKANYRYIGRHCWQMRIGDKWRNAPRRFMTAQLKYYGLTLAQLKEAAQ